MLRLVQFKTLQSSSTRLGALLPAGVLDVTKLTSLTSMLAFIQEGESAVTAVQKALTDKHTLVGLESIKLLAPITPVRNIMCVGKNYKDHVAEVANADKARGVGTSTPADAPAYPKYPQFFTKATTTVVGPGDHVRAHGSVTKWLDYEAELAVIIGRGGVDIPREAALSHVFGYTVANDITSRDVQKHHNQWFKGKSLDTTCPLGPCILLNQGVNPANLNVKMSINGEVRQNSNTSVMIFDIPEIIAQLSRGMTLLPGDIILTGTPQGVGYAMTPPQMLKAGDEMIAEVEHIGRLVNRVVE